jgi:hypothetical protein
MLIIKLTITDRAEFSYMLEYAAVYFPKNILSYVNILKIYYEQKIFKTGADELEGDSVSEKGGGV